MNLTTATCESCSQQFSFEPIIFGGRQLFTQRVCDPCNEILLIEQDEEARRTSENSAKTRFQLMIPPIYLDTDINRIPRQMMETIDSWEYGPTGLGLIGSSGQCKTRSAVLLLRRMHTDRRSTFFTSATDLALNSANQFADNPVTRDIARSQLTLCRTAEVLLIDDIGKGRMTDRAESEFYDLLEYRTSHRTPTIWTSNSDGKQLREMFSRDRGEAIIRRLGTEFTTIIRC